MSKPFAHLITERALQSIVERELREWGWLPYHTRYSMMSKGGFPDVVAAHAGFKVVVYAELKRDGLKPTRMQCEWLDTLRDAGQWVYLWTPAHLEKIYEIVREGPKRGEAYGEWEVSK